jgi:hypothetical protein
MRAPAIAVRLALAIVTFAFASPARAEDARESGTDAEAEAPGTAGAASATRNAEVAALRETVARHDAELAKLGEPAALRFSGYVQADWVASSQASENEIDASTGSPLNESRFLLRRGHLRADYAKGYVAGALEVDANTINGPQLRPVDAEASLRWPSQPRADGLQLMVTAGLFKTPFGYEVLEADNKRPFLERSTVIRALVPGEYDLGLRVRGQWRAFNYALGLMNGDPIGERAFPGRDPNKSKDVVLRAGIDVPLLRGVRLAAGASGISGTGFHAGTPTTKDVLVWRDANEDGIVQPTEIQVIPGGAATPSQLFHRFALGADARLAIDVPVVGELALRSEIVWASNLDRAVVPADPIAAGRDQRELGFYVGVTQELTPWGMIGVRYDRYDPDADASEQRGAALVPRDRAFSTYAFMGMLRHGPGRLIVEYDRRGNALGRTTSGDPTTLASDTLTMRAEVTF